MKKTAFLRSLLTLLVMAVWGGVNDAKAQQVIFEEDFSSITNGNNTSTNGSSSTWTINKNFSAATAVYQAGGAIKLGSSSKVGSITTKELNLSGYEGKYTVTFDVKGWSSVEGTLDVTPSNGEKQSCTYKETMSGNFGTYSLKFEGGTAETKITFATSAKRAFIDNIKITQGEAVTKETQTLTFSGTNFTINQNEDFEEPELYGAQTTVTYISSNTDVATVDKTTGAVSIVGPGTTTITATAAANDTYYAASASYTLTVNRVLGNNVIWFEDFSSGSLDNYTIENGGGTTKIYENDNTAGGTAPEILIAKENGSLTVSNLNLKGYTGTFVLTFKSNNGISEITTTTTGVKIKKIGFTKPNGTYEVYVPEGITSLDLALTNTNKSSNTRVDDIELVHMYDLLTLNISSVGYATFCADKNFIMTSGVKGCIVTVDGTTANAEAKYTFTDNIFASDIVPSGTGLLMKGEAGEYKMFATTKEATETYEQNLCSALTNDKIDVPTDATAKFYIFANDEQGLGFYYQKGTEGNFVQNMAGKAYLAVYGEAAVQGFRLNLGDITGISAVETTNENAPIYNLSGVRVLGNLNSLPAGIYIVGGKKVYVK